MSNNVRFGEQKMRFNLITKTSSAIGRRQGFIRLIVACTVYSTNFLDRFRRCSKQWSWVFWSEGRVTQL